MTATQFKRAADHACDLTPEQAHKLFYEITGWLSAENGRPATGRDMLMFRQYVSDRIDEELKH